MPSTLASLGRLDKLLESGQLDALLASLSRFSEKLVALGAHERGETLTTRTRRIGPALIFERLWRELGISEVIRELAQGRKFSFDLERALFLTVLHRLFAPGSDRAVEKRKHSSPAAATCSPHWTWFSWAPPRSTSRARAAPQWASTVSARATGPI